MLQGMPNGTTKAKLLGKYSLTLVCQKTVVGCLIKLGFLYKYDVNKNYLDGYEMKDVVCYRWNLIYCHLLLERCICRWINMTAEESDQYKGYTK